MVMDYVIREMNADDFEGLSQLYTHLHSNKPIEKNDKNLSLFNEILADKNHHIIVAETDGKIVSSCVCVVVPNLTHNQKPYALLLIRITEKTVLLLRVFLMQSRLHLIIIVIK